ncbi:unnamed protein product [Prorocentrum cordatum]|uniref:Uncharacterized protein n=1 Tax=Prorocentrum cordatum TaxID=2364126 RepID=A0ABN9S4M6_9DINO|nr:unnamed protein product [Polarella glacialis]
MRVRASWPLVLLLSLALVQPGSCGRVDVVAHHANEGQAGEPVSFTISTVAAMGSLYSVYKTRKLIRQERHEMEAAKQLIAEHAARLSKGCALIDQVDRMLAAQRQSLESVSQAQHEELVVACNDHDKIKRSADYLAGEILQVCEELAPRASAAAQPCRNLSADLHSGGLGRACALVDREQRDALSRRLDLDRARLDGLKAGLACPEYGEAARDGLLAGTSTGLLEEQAVARSGAGAIVDTISLLYSILGTGDFALDLVDTVVNTNRGFVATFDFTEKHALAVQALMCKSFSKFWVQMIMAHTVTLSTVFDQYYSPSRLQPPASLGTLTMLPDRGWPLDTTQPSLKMSQGSAWICHNAKHCLVPADPYMSESSRAGGVGNHNPDVGSCSVKDGDQFLLCGHGEEVTLMLPKVCFNTFFTHNEQIAPSLKIVGSAYVHTYGHGKGPQRGHSGLGGNTLDWDQCLQPLQHMHDVVHGSRDELEKASGMMKDVCE